MPRPTVPDNPELEALARTLHNCENPHCDLYSGRNLAVAQKLLDAGWTLLPPATRQPDFSPEFRDPVADPDVEVLSESPDQRPTPASLGALIAEVEMWHNIRMTPMSERTDAEMNFLRGHPLGRVLSGPARARIFIKYLKTLHFVGEEREPNEPLTDYRATGLEHLLEIVQDQTLDAADRVTAARTLMDYAPYYPPLDGEKSSPDADTYSDSGPSPLGVEDEDEGDNKIPEWTAGRPDFYTLSQMIEPPLVSRELLELAVEEAGAMLNNSIRTPATKLMAAEVLIEAAKLDRR